VRLLPFLPKTKGYREYVKVTCPQTATPVTLRFKCRNCEHYKGAGSPASVGGDGQGVKCDYEGFHESWHKVITKLSK
jgi:hypothetical protein